MNTEHAKYSYYFVHYLWICSKFLVYALGAFDIDSLNKINFNNSAF